MKKVIQVKTASEFVDYLRLTHPLWDMQVPGDTRWISREKWAFRGQSNATWSLVPSAFRPNTILGFKPGATTPLSSPIDRKEQERKTLNDFLFFADRMGLRVAGDDIRFRIPSLPGHDPKLPANFWPWEHAIEVLAVAQHHGIPTRLLDFTYNPMVAAFFAAYDAWGNLGRPNLKAEINSDDEIAVWAVHLPLLYTEVDQATRAQLTPKIILVSAPRAENSYLDKQDGFFLLDLEADQHNYPPMQDALDMVKETVNQRERTATGKTRYAGDQVYQLTLPVKKVPNLLAILWNELYNISKLQPTHDKAVQALKDHRDLFA